MKSRDRLRRTGDNEYTRATGIRAYTLKGGSACVVSAYDTVYSRFPVQPHAFYVFHIKDKESGITFNTRIKVHSTCGATNCVNREHLIGEYKPTKADIQYIKDYLPTDGLTLIAQRLNVPSSLLSSYIESNPL